MNSIVKVTAEIVPGSWERALRAARNTVWKGHDDKHPSVLFKKSMCRSEHSPLRLVEYYIHIEGIPYWTTPHFTRHKLGVEWFQSTLRDDRTTKYTGSRDEAPQGMPVNLDCQVNAAELIFMARRRLCRMSHYVTRAVMRMIVDEIRRIDPVVAEYMVPNCVYRGFCPETNGCGYTKTAEFYDLCRYYRE